MQSWCTGTAGSWGSPWGQASGDAPPARAGRAQADGLPAPGRRPPRSRGCGPGASAAPSGKPSGSASGPDASAQPRLPCRRRSAAPAGSGRLPRDAAQEVRDHAAASQHAGRSPRPPRLPLAGGLHSVFPQVLVVHPDVGHLPQAHAAGPQPRLALPRASPTQVLPEQLSGAEPALHAHVAGGGGERTVGQLV